MNRDDANQLAKRIVNCWRTTIPRNEWADYLAGLDDADRAERTFLLLREREAKSFREFGDAYRSLGRAAGTQPAPQSSNEDTASPRPTWEQVKALLLANGAPERLITRRPLTDAEADRLIAAIRKETA